MIHLTEAIAGVNRPPKYKSLYSLTLGEKIYGWWDRTGSGFGRTGWKEPKEFVVSKIDIKGIGLNGVESGEYGLIQTHNSHVEILEGGFAEDKVVYWFGKGSRTYVFGRRKDTVQKLVDKYK